MKSNTLTSSNRVNALKSTGPRSLAGKAASCMNRLTTGMYATKLIIPGEDPADFDKLTQEYYDSKLPRTPEERFHLDVMIRSEWQLRRFDHVETQLWEFRLQETLSRTPAECALGKIYYNADTVFARLERQRTTAYRNYKEASAELAALQAARYVVEQPQWPATGVTDLPVDPQPIAPETTYPQIGFVPSNESTMAPSPEGVPDSCSSEEPAPSIRLRSVSAAGQAPPSRPRRTLGLSILSPAPPRAMETQPWLPAPHQRLKNPPRRGNAMNPDNTRK